MVTIHDVAARAGVSLASVSRVMNSSGKVSEPTRDAVLRAASELGYRPDVCGGYSPLGKRTILAVYSYVFPDFPILAILDGIKEAVDAAGYDVLFIPMVGAADESFVKYLENGTAAGVIFINYPGSLAGLETLAGRYPVVQCGDFVKFSGANLVSIDHYHTMYDLTEHLLQIGRRRIAGFFLHFDTPSAESSARECVNGFRGALLNGGGVYSPELETYFSYKQDLSFGECAQLLHRYMDAAPEKRPDALICHDTRLACYCVNALRRLGISVPETVSVAAFSGSVLSLLSDPQITTPKYAHAELGRESTRLLLSLLEAKHRGPPKQILLEHEIVVRGSTDGGIQSPFAANGGA